MKNLLSKFDLIANGALDLPPVHRTYCLLSEIAADLRSYFKYIKSPNVSSVFRQGSSILIFYSTVPLSMDSADLSMRDNVRHVFVNSLESRFQTSMQEVIHSMRININPCATDSIGDNFDCLNAVTNIIGYYPAILLELRTRLETYLGVDTPDVKMVREYMSELFYILENPVFRERVDLGRYCVEIDVAHESDTLESLNRMLSF